MNFRNLQRTFLFLGALLTATYLSAFAAEESTAPQLTDESHLTVLIKDRQTFKSDVHRMPGSIRVNQSDFELTYEDKAFDVLPVVLGFDYKHLDINENIPVALPSRLEGRRFLIGTKFPLPFVVSDEYFMGVDVMPSWYTDQWTWENSAFRLPFRTYFIYKPSETYVFVVGATIDVNADNPVLPIIGINYQPNDRWNILLASSNPTISYKLSDSWSLFAEYGATLDEYEVKRGGQKGVVLKVREATLGAGIKYSIEKWLDVSLSGGSSLARRFAYRDTVGKVDVDSAPYFKADLSVKF